MKLKRLFSIALIAVAAIAFTGCEEYKEGYQPMLWAYSSSMYDRFPGEEKTINVASSGESLRFNCINRHAIWFSKADPSDLFSSSEISAQGFYNGSIRSLQFTIEFEANTTGEERTLTVVAGGDGGSFTFNFVQPAM